MASPCIAVCDINCTINYLEWSSNKQLEYLKKKYIVTEFFCLKSSAEFISFRTFFFYKS